MRIPVSAVALALWVMWPAGLEGQAVAGAADRPPEVDGAWTRSAPGPGTRWSLGVEWVRMGISDEVASPLRHRGNGFGATLGRRSEARASSWSLQLAVRSATVESDIVTRVGGFEDDFGAELDFHYLRRVGSLVGGRIGLLAGGSLGAWATVREHHYNGLVPETYGDLFAPLQLSGAWEIRLGSGHLRHALSVPVLALVMRSPWSGLKYIPDVELGGPWNLEGVSSRLEISPGRSGPVGVGFFWNIRLFRYDEPLPLASAAHRVGVRLEWDR